MKAILESRSEFTGNMLRQEFGGGVHRVKGVHTVEISILEGLDDGVEQPFQRMKIT